MNYFGQIKDDENHLIRKKRERKENLFIIEKLEKVVGQ